MVRCPRRPTSVMESSSEVVFNSPAFVVCRFCQLILLLSLSLFMVNFCARVVFTPSFIHSFIYSPSAVLPSFAFASLALVA